MQTSCAWCCFKVTPPKHGMGPLFDQAFSRRSNVSVTRLLLHHFYNISRLPSAQQLFPVHFSAGPAASANTPCTTRLCGRRATGDFPPRPRFPSRHWRLATLFQGLHVSVGWRSSQRIFPWFAHSFFDAICSVFFMFGTGLCNWPYLCTFKVLPNHVVASRRTEHLCAV